MVSFFSSMGLSSSSSLPRVSIPSIASKVPPSETVVPVIPFDIFSRATLASRFPFFTFFRSYTPAKRPKGLYLIAEPAILKGTFLNGNIVSINVATATFPAAKVVSEFFVSMFFHCVRSCTIALWSLKVPFSASSIAILVAFS